MLLFINYKVAKRYQDNCYDLSITVARKKIAHTKITNLCMDRRHTSRPFRPNHRDNQFYHRKHNVS